MNKEKFIINGLSGRKTLSGSISVNGAKNSALKALASVFLFEDGLRLKNVPNIADVKQIILLLEDLGVKVSVPRKDEYHLNVEKIKKTDLDATISSQLRASIVLTGPILTRLGRVSFPHPGGCVIGERPIDIFLSSFKKMGAKIKVAHSPKGSKYVIESKGRLKGAEIFLPNQSVTVTETIMMAATLAEGKTVIKNVAMEPEITDLANFLNSCGAKIKGAGTSTIEITGVKILKSKKKAYKIPADRIEAGSFLLLGVLCARNLEIKNCDPSTLESLIETLKHSGVNLKIGKNNIKITNNLKKNSAFRAVNIKTHEYPGFPTDLQAPMTVFLTQASGDSTVFETIFEGRLGYTEGLIRMGAKITNWDDHHIMIKGPNTLRAKELESPDLRAGLAFIIAAIVAKGQSVIHNIHYIDRGYEEIEERLKKIGVNIKRIKE